MTLEMRWRILFVLYVLASLLQGSCFVLSVCCSGIIPVLLVYLLLMLQTRAVVRTVLQIASTLAPILIMFKLKLRFKMSEANGVDENCRFPLATGKQAGDWLLIRVA